MRRIVITLIVIIPAFALAQQDEQFTQFMHNRVFYNVGAAGTEDNICVSAFHRSQWVGFEGAPITQNINITAPIKKLHGGVNLTITNDQIGFYSNFGASLGYSFNLNLGNGVLGIGAAGSFRSQSTNAGEWIPPDINRPFGNLDVALIATDASGSMIDVNFGAYYRAANWWAGISSTRLIEANTTVDGEFPVSGAATFGNFRHIYVMGGYSWAVPRSNWNIEPAFLLKMSNASPTYDINVSGVYNNKIWGGVTYRNEDALAALVGYQFTPSLKAGYSYDVGTSELASSAGGSHEIMVTYCFKIVVEPKIPPSNRNIRFL